MISVVIPSYNQQDFLPDAIESVLVQRNMFKQIIIVDDGSTDNSLEIAKKYEQANPKEITVISQVNKGLASARNTGFMQTLVRDWMINSWVLFLDADDILVDKALETIIGVINRNEDADIIAPSFKTFGTSNEQVILMKNPKLEDFRTGNRIGYCAAIRKSALLEIGGYDPQMIWGYEDLSLTCQLLARGKKLVTIPEVLWLYRTKSESMWTKALEHHQDLLDIINKKVPEAQLSF